MKKILLFMLFALCLENTYALSIKEIKKDVLVIKMRSNQIKKGDLLLLKNDKERVAIIRVVKKAKSAFAAKVLKSYGDYSLANKIARYQKELPLETSKKENPKINLSSGIPTQSQSQTQAKSFSLELGLGIASLGDLVQGGNETGQEFSMYPGLSLEVGYYFTPNIKAGLRYSKYSGEASLFFTENELRGDPIKYDGSLSSIQLFGDYIWQTQKWSYSLGLFWGIIAGHDFDVLDPTSTTTTISYSGSNFGLSAGLSRLITQNFYWGVDLVYEANSYTESEFNQSGAFPDDITQTIIKVQGVIGYRF